jgi:acetyl-CoA acetyltransferase
MSFAAEIPYGAYWSTPFARWQGSLAQRNSVVLAAETAKAELARRRIDPTSFDYGVLGLTVPQPHAFYGLPWLAGLIGAPQLAGPTINQACATGARVVLAAAQEIAAGDAAQVLVIAADRTSNGPDLYYPNPQGPGGAGTRENWVLDNFNHDPFAKVAMIDTAETVARKYQIGIAEQHDVVLRRHAQYHDALADDRAFLKRFIALPFALPGSRGRPGATLDGDEGVHPTSAEGLARLEPVKPGGTVTYAAQTHPADGNVGMVVCAPDCAADLSTRPEIRIRLLGFGQSRVAPGHMPEAPVAAAKRALAAAELEIGAIDAVKSHNPFAINDIVFARETGYPLERMNNFGCSLVWGHPQGPTGLRSIVELIEELALSGGGRGLFQGCAAGDSAMAVVLEVGDRPS